MIVFSFLDIVVPGCDSVCDAVHSHCVQWDGEVARQTAGELGVAHQWCYQTAVTSVVVVHTTVYIDSNVSLNCVLQLSIYQHYCVSRKFTSITLKKPYNYYAA